MLDPLLMSRPVDLERAPRVVQVVGNSIVGGGETQVLWLVDGLRRLGVEVAEVVCPREGPLTDALGERGITVSCFDMGAWTEQGVVLPDSVEALRERFLELEPDIVHCHLVPALIHGAEAAVRADVPVVAYTVHGLEGLLGNDVRREHDVVSLAVCRAGARRLIDRGLRPDLVEVIHNGVPSAYFSADRRAAAQLRAEIGQGRGPVLGSVARLSWEKGVDLLVAAMPRVLSEYPDAVAVLVGTGPEEDSLREQVAQLDLESQVVFLGARADAPLLCEAFDVFVLPSRSEGCPLALLEAMAAGRPCVASAVGGVPEVLRDGLEGVLVPFEDPAALAGSVLRLLRDDAFRARAARAARHRAATHFTQERMAEETLALYRRRLAAVSARAQVPATTV